MAVPRFRRCPWIALVVGLVACGGPILVFPGGALDGPVEPAPDSFTFAAEAGTIQLETRGGEAYSVNIAGIVVQGALYVSAGDNKARWVEHMEANPLVRVRIEGILYELEAHRVVDDAEMRAFAMAWTSRVPFGRDPTELGEVWVYRLERR